MKYIKLWLFLTLFSAIWTWKQQNIGFTPKESSFLYGRGATTHIIQGGTLIRYFSTFSDAANYGCNAAASSVTFIIIAITSKIKWEKLFFLIILLIRMKSTTKAAKINRGIWSGRSLLMYWITPCTDPLHNVRIKVHSCSIISYLLK